ncbi:hypothetical protein GCM10027612_87070 [Microbispora bryophytorum subsp. camponoti]
MAGSAGDPLSTVRPSLPALVDVVDFGATSEGAPVLAALKSLPGLLGRKRVGPDEIDTDLLVGSWRRLVLSAPHLEAGCVDWKAYAFCVLEHFHRMLRRCEIFARNSSKWGDLRAKLLAGDAWRQVRPTLLASLGLAGCSTSTPAKRYPLDFPPLLPGPQLAGELAGAPIPGAADAAARTPLARPLRRRRAPGDVTPRPGRGHDEAGAAAPDVRAACTMRIASPASMPTLAITAA